MTLMQIILQDLITNLYLRDGVFYIITDRRDTFPAKLGYFLKEAPSADGGHPEPTDGRIQVITSDEASGTLGVAAVRKTGISVGLTRILPSLSSLLPTVSPHVPCFE